MNTVLSLFLFAAAIGWLEYRLRGLNKANDQDQKGAFDFFATKEELKKAVKSLTAKADADRQAIDERITSVEEKAFFAAQTDGQEEKKPVDTRQEEDPAVVYFRWPGDDGTFIDTQRQRVQTEETYYLFRLDESRTKADFSFVTMSDTQLSKANNSSKKYIERACIFTGAKSAQYVCTPGQAHLERGRWIIDVKARIDYR